MYSSFPSVIGYGAAVGTLIFTWIISIAVAALCIIGLWKIYVKAGKPGWAAIVPGYNLYVLFEITYGNGWKLFLLLIPVYNIILSILVYIRLARAFGKSGGFACGLIFLAPIFLPILGFGSDAYLGIPE